ncbi:succinylglutamate desuccinylase/aspartoacylase family protein [Crenobacter sp. SG2305]|uniref:succinylglutamate desuccinylase/aspartoacylase family protein n=1 Tax=Crenobacter oryzisoli TaxID=3056844 RepID=UPI0025AA9535|nr:succinylglutamate desuccinylase/aspartoacylase family protein [Crenobacter sp. SG2305]MDN0085649.1 succinylglutamate desuccinylase/aspartoacylase family protein [Crenobacter sp. SG2305]
MKRIEHALLSPSLGAARQLTSLHFGQAGSGPKAYIQAALHADELPGMLVAWHLKAAFTQLEAAGHLHGEIVLVPQANPIGNDQTLLGQQLGRFDLASGENFNRHYPQLAQTIYPRVKARLGRDGAHNTRIIRDALRAAIEQTPVRTELHSLRQHLMRLAVDADIVLDLHCDYDAALHVYTGTPLWGQCEPLARYLGSSAQFLSTEAGGDPFDEACCRVWWELQALAANDRLEAPIELACLAVTVELRGQGDVKHSQAKQDAAAIIDFLRHRGLVTDRPAPEMPALKQPATPLAGSENLYAPHPGVVAFLVAPGSRVEAGQPVAEVIDPLNDRVAVLASQYGGVVYALENRHYASAGMWVAKVATATAFKTGSLLSA